MKHRKNARRRVHDVAKRKGRGKLNGIREVLAPNATVFAASGCVMIVELVAGRLVSRYLGQSLYTWTAIIGLVLAGISIGNYVGGRLADRFRPPRLLALLFILTSVGCLAVLALNDCVGKWEAVGSLAWPVRIFCHVALVFVLPSALLGTISPVVARMALSFGRAPGRTFGTVYAWGAAGSIAGTFLAGFYLVLAMGATAIILTVAGLLALTGVAYGVMSFTRPDAPPVARQRTASHVNTGEQRGGAARHISDWLVPNATVFLASLCIMVMELVVGRMASRHLGQSLYTWTTVIGVVLAGITLGSYMGGKLADRLNVKKTLSALSVLASATCLTVPALNNWMAGAYQLTGLAWPARVFVHIAVTFLVPATVLGTILPVAARMALSRGHPMGRTVGSFYAWGTIGSIAGTFLAGFFLISALGGHGVVVAASGLLGLLGLWHGRRQRLAHAWAFVCVVALAATFLPGAVAEQIGRRLALRETHDPWVIYADESQYSYIAINADPDRPNVREMFLDKLIHSKADITNPTGLEYEYEWIYSAVLDRYWSSGEPISAMVIGGGGYAYPRYLELTRPGSHIDVAEIDPAVTEAAHIAFGLPWNTAINIYNVDARNFVTDLMRRKRAGGTVPAYDCILGDSINDYAVPYHLTTREFTEDIATLLSNEGLYLLNLIDILDSGNFLGAVVNTCRQVFPCVYVLSTRSNPSERDTFVVVNARRPLDLSGLAASLRAERKFGGELLTQDQVAWLKTASGGIVLTDDYAPVENLLAPVVRGQKRGPEERLVQKAGWLFAEGKVDEAIQALEKARAFAPRWARVHQYLGNVHWKRGDKYEALAAWRRAISLDPSAEVVHNNLGNALYETGQVQEAERHFREAVRIKPDYAMAHNDLGGVLSIEGRLQEAIEHFSKAIEVNPNFGLARLNYAQVLTRLNRVEGALTQYREAVRLMPDNATANYGLANTLARLNRFDEAVPHYGTAVSLRPEDPDVHNRLGHALFALDRVDEALEQFAEAVRLNPRDSSAHNNLGSALASKGELERALAHFAEAAKIRPDYLNARINLGKVLLELGRFEGAADAFREALRLDPQSDGAAKGLERALAQRPT